MVIVHGFQFTVFDEGWNIRDFFCRSRQKTNLLKTDRRIERILKNNLEKWDTYLNRL